ncbi:hypothetical protein KHQ81_09385 [Mycoplasmatota bacterium]|nr:hypothetical protein KHQ81_09385 [Mycoplasmatota bacterium]
MFFKLLIIAVLQLIVYERIGSVVKHLFKIKFKHMNLIIGYLFSLLIFYSINVYFVLRHYPYTLFENILFPIYIVIMFIFLMLSTRRKSIKFDYIIIILILAYIYHFLTLAFIIPGEASEYLSTIHQNINQAINLSAFQTYTLMYSSFLNINSTVYCVNVVTFIHLFMIMYTIYECFCVLFHSTKNCRYAFIFFLLLFTVVNSGIRDILLPQNAYQFIYYPFSGEAVYLYAIVPFQWVLFYRLDKNNFLLFFLINMTAMALTPISLFMQFLINIAFIITLLLIKAYKTPQLLATLIFVSLFPLFFHLIIYSYHPNIKLLYYIVFLLLIASVSLITYQKKNHHQKILLFSSIIFVVFLMFLYNYLFKKLDLNINEEVILQIKKEYRNQRPQLLLFYGLGLYALFKLTKEDIQIKKVLFYLPMVVLLILINPVTVYFVIKHHIQFTYLMCLIPLAFSITYMFIKKTRIIEKAIILLLFIGVSHTIYDSLESLRSTNQNVFYRIDNDALILSDYLNQNKEIKNILVTSDLLNEITVNTENINLLLTNQDLQENNQVFIDEELLLMYYTINDKVPIDVVLFADNITQYNIDAIIVDKNKMVNSYLDLLCKSKKEFSYYNIYMF